MIQLLAAPYSQLGPTYAHLVCTVRLLDNIQRKILRPAHQREPESFGGFLRHREHISAQIFRFGDDRQFRLRYYGAKRKGTVKRTSFKQANPFEGSP